MKNGNFAFSAIGPEGERMTRASLPGPNERRWTALRKGRVVAAVNGGLISQQEACSRYAMTEDEFKQWKVGFSNHGLRGLRVTRSGPRRGASE